MANIMEVNGVQIDTLDIFNKYLEWGDKRQVSAYIVGLTDCTEKEALTALRSIIKNSGIISNADRRKTEPYHIDREEIMLLSVDSPYQKICINGVYFSPSEIYKLYINTSGNDDNKRRQTVYHIAYKARLDMTVEDNKYGVESIINAVLAYAKRHSDAMIDREADRNTPQKVYIPKCPVCGSPDIKKISGLSRAVSFEAFGFASSTARAQRQCRNCGYKF